MTDEGILCFTATMGIPIVFGVVYWLHYIGGGSPEEKKVQP